MQDSMAVVAPPPDLRTWSGGRRCVQEHCGAWSIRTPDLLSYALDHHVWTCSAGHRTPDGEGDPSPLMALDPLRSWTAVRELPAPRPSPTSEEFHAAAEHVVREADLDLVELLQVLVETCTALVGADSGSVVLVDPAGAMHPVASSTEDAVLTDLVRVTAMEGPGLLCLTERRRVGLPDLEQVLGRWPGMGPAMRRHGTRSMHVTPLAVHDGPIGFIAVFFTASGALGAETGTALRALVDEALDAAAGAALARTAHHHLTDALDTRVLIERATGVLMAVHGITSAVARTRMAAHADVNRLTVAEVARAVLDRTLELPLAGHWRRRESKRPPQVLPGVLLGRADAGHLTEEGSIDADIVRLLEQAAETHRAEGRTALARTHLAAAKAISGIHDDGRPARGRREDPVAQDAPTAPRPCRQRPGRDVPVDPRPRAP